MRSYPVKKEIFSADHITPNDQLVELRKPPVDMNDALGQDNPLSGILGKALGESSSEQAERLEEAKKNATDLSGLVRKKNKDTEPKTEPAGEGSGKRKAEDPADGEESDSKKTKVEEAQ